MDDTDFDAGAVVILASGEYEMRSVDFVVSMTRAGNLSELARQFAAELGDAAGRAEYGFNRWLVNNGHARVLPAFLAESFFSGEKGHQREPLAVLHRVPSAEA